MLTSPLTISDAMALPIPFDAPVTSATFPSSGTRPFPPVEFAFIASSPFRQRYTNPILWVPEAIERRPRLSGDNLPEFGRPALQVSAA
jgi:hypothetical protein